MPIDIKSVDPAIVKVEAKQERVRSKPQGPVFTFFVHPVVKSEEEGAFVPAVNAETTVVYHSSDDKYLSIARSVAEKAPFKFTAADSVVEVPFNAEAITTIVHWCEKHGVDGKAETVFPNPINHTDLSVLLTSDWEKSFNTHVLARIDGSDVYVSSINAAEALKLNHLLDFLVVALSCAIRGKSDLEILTALHDTKPVEDEDIALAKQKYSWLESATTPKTA